MTIQWPQVVFVSFGLATVVHLFSENATSCNRGAGDLVHSMEMGGGGVMGTGGGVDEYWRGC